MATKTSKKKTKKSPKKTKAKASKKPATAKEIPESANYQLLLVGGGGGGGDTIQESLPPIDYSLVFPESEPPKKKPWWKFW